MPGAVFSHPMRRQEAQRAKPARDEVGRVRRKRYPCFRSARVPIRRTLDQDFPRVTRLLHPSESVDGLRQRKSARRQRPEKAALELHPQLIEFDLNAGGVRAA